MTKPTFGEAMKFWVKLGFISFGGPAGQIAIMHEYLVEKKKWISESKFMHALNYCMLLPGPEAQQLATYSGWMLHGTRGGLAAGILFVLPSMFILLGLSIAYVEYGNIPWIYALFNGLKPAVIAMIILALVKISKRSLVTPLHYLIALMAFVCIFFFNLAFPLIIVGAITIAAIIRQLIPALFKKGHGEKESLADDERDYVINRHTVVAHTTYNAGRFRKQVLLAAVLWVTPWLAFYLLAGDFSFWSRLSTFFTKAAFVTFGGAYAVLPYVAQVSVEKFHWLTNLQMIDGLALGETTPGPLIMVLAFVGFMSGYNHFGHSLAMGSLGLLTTTYYTFLPCFLFIFAGAPFIERTHANKKIKEILSLVTAAVVGVILNLTMYLGQAIIFPTGYSLQSMDSVALGWVAISLVAMYNLKISIITWIGISALFGLAVHLVMH